MDVAGARGVGHVSSWRPVVGPFPRHSLAPCAHGMGVNSTQQCSIPVSGPQRARRRDSPVLRVHMHCNVQKSSLTLMWCVYARAPPAASHATQKPLDPFTHTPTQTSTMSFKDVAALNGYLADKTYIQGYNFSPKDVEVFQKFAMPDAASAPHAYRWYIHIAALTGIPAAMASMAANAAPAPAKEAKKPAKKVMAV